MELPDLRTQLAEAEEWLITLVANVRDDQWTSPTPCTEYDVRTLVEHLFAVQERIRRMGVDHTIGDAPHSIPLPPHDVAGALRAAAKEATAAWDDDRVLGEQVRAPWGTIPGAAAVGAYLSEIVTHGWDLAVATGQPAKSPAGTAEAAYAVMQRALPADGRAQHPFDDPVAPAGDAGATERLANWTGRVSR